MTDLELLARLIVCEAGGEGYDGMQAVATVVMNRVNSFYGEYGRYNTVADAILQQRQFTCISSQARNIYLVSPTALHYEIAEWALNGGRLGSVADSLWFYNPYSEVCAPTFPNPSGSYFIRIGEHCFYRPTAAYYNT